MLKRAVLVVERDPGMVDSFAPAGARLRRASIHGFRPAEAGLHPWLQSVAPFGAQAEWKREIREIVREREIREVVREREIREIVREREIREIVREREIREVVWEREIREVVWERRSSAMAFIGEVDHRRVRLSSVRGGSAGDWS